MNYEKCTSWIWVSMHFVFAFIPFDYCFLDIGHVVHAVLRCCCCCCIWHNEDGDSRRQKFHHHFYLRNTISKQLCAQTASKPYECTLYVLRRYITIPAKSLSDSVQQTVFIVKLYGWTRMVFTVFVHNTTSVTHGVHDVTMRNNR